MLPLTIDSMYNYNISRDGNYKYQLILVILSLMRHGLRIPRYLGEERRQVFLE